jgi:hypothetical protein
MSPEGNDARFFLSSVLMAEALFDAIRVASLGGNLGQYRGAEQHLHARHDMWQSIFTTIHAVKWPATPRSRREGSSSDASDDGSARKPVGAREKSPWEPLTTGDNDEA